MCRTGVYGGWGLIEGLCVCVGGGGGGSVFLNTMFVSASTR